MNVFSWRKPLMLILVLALSLVLATVAFSQAEETPEPVGDEFLAMHDLCDTSFDGLTVSVPCDWPTWKSEDYPISALGRDALLEMVREVMPEFEIRQEMTNERFMAIAPELTNGSLAVMRVASIAYSDIVALYDSEEELDPRQIMSDGVATMEYVPIGWLTINGRQAALAGKTFTSNGQLVWMDMMVIIVFEETDTLAVVALGGPPEFVAEYGEVLNFMVSSIRLEGEPFDTNTIASLNTPTTDFPDPETGP